MRSIAIEARGCEAARTALALTAIIGFAHATGLRAQTPGLRVELRVAGDMDMRLFDRLRGQTSDLLIEVRSYRPAHTAPSMAAAVTDAFTRCREGHADVVVWLLPGRAPAERAWQLAVASCSDHHLLVRRVDAARPALSGSDATQSGLLETAALLLRAALSVVAHGGRIGVASPAKAAAHSPPSAASSAEPPGAQAAPAGADQPTRPADASAPHAQPSSMHAIAPHPEPRSMHALDQDSSDSASRARDPSRDDQRDTAERRRATGPAAQDEPQRGDAVPASSSSLSFDTLVLLGWQQTWENARRALSQPALAGTFALGGARFKLGLAATFGFGTTYRDAYTATRLARHTLALQARLNALQLPAWSISTGLGLGALLYTRSARELSPAAKVSAAASFAEPLLRVWLSAGTQIGPLWIVLSSGIEVLPWTPRLVYRRANGVDRVAVPIWPVSPCLSLSLGLGRP